MSGENGDSNADSAEGSQIEVIQSNNKQAESGYINDNFTINSFKTAYYASEDNTSTSTSGSTIQISSIPPNTTPNNYSSLYDIALPNATYSLTNSALPDISNIASFYVFKSDSKIENLENYKVSGDETTPFKYVFPSLTVADIDEIFASSPAASGGKRRALSSCTKSGTEPAKINAMLQLLYDIEDFKTNIDGLSTSATDNNIKTLSANLKTIFDFINGVGSAEDKNVCPAIEKIQTFFNINTTTDDLKTVSNKIYEGMNTIFESEFKNEYGLIKINNSGTYLPNLPYFVPDLTRQMNKPKSLKSLIEIMDYINNSFSISTAPKLEGAITAPKLNDDAKYIVIGYDRTDKIKISNKINVLSNDAKDDNRATKPFYLVGYQYLKDNTTKFAYKNILLNKKFEDDKEESRSFLGIGSDDTKSNFVALYSSTKPEVLPPPPPQKSSNFNKFIKLSKTPQASLFSGGDDSEISNEPPKQVQTKFRVSRRKSRKSKQ